MMALLLCFHQNYMKLILLPCETKTTIIFEHVLAFYTTYLQYLHYLYKIKLNILNLNNKLNLLK